MTATLELTHRYAPRGAALELLQSTDPEVLISGPAGTGKSRACLEKILLIALNRPGSAHLIVRKTYKSLTNTVLKTWREWVAPEVIASGACWWYGGSSEKPPGYYFENGSVINIAGMDDPTKVMSAEYDTVYIAEATELNEDHWDKLGTRLRNGRVKYHRLIADCNPSHPQHWLKQRCDNGQTKMLNSVHVDNPRLSSDGETIDTEEGIAYMSRLDNMVGYNRSRLRDGLWVAAEGIVYGDVFDEAKHLIDPPADWEVLPGIGPIPPVEWQRLWAVDFGYTNPFVCQFWAVRPTDGALFLYREVYYTQRLVEEHAAKILKQCVAWSGKGEEPEMSRLTRGEDIVKLINSGHLEWVDAKPREVICDHDAEDRATLKKHLGKSTRPAYKAVETGIEAVQSRYKRDLLFIVKGALVEKDPKLVKTKQPTCTAEEIPGYTYPELADINADKKPRDEKPKKVRDHGQDAKRYVVARCDLKRKLDVTREVWA